MERAFDHTTPEPITLHRVLAQAAAAGVTHGAMEASSHGLAQKRLDGVDLAVAGFTNFTQDHLDYHATFEAYFAAKSGLFDRVLGPQGWAVINIDDAKGMVLYDACRSAWTKLSDRRSRRSGFADFRRKPLRPTVKKFYAPGRGNGIRSKCLWWAGSKGKTCFWLRAWYWRQARRLKRSFLD